MTSAGVPSWAVAIGCYLLGSIPFGLLWGRIVGGIDVREHGSHNVGATNVGRLLGTAHGALVFLLDAGKGVAAVAAGRAWIPREEGAVLCGMLAVLGHVTSPWLRFRGGKGVATGLGVWAMLAPWATLCAAGAWGAALAVSRRVSAASLCAAAVLPFAVLLLRSPGAPMAWLLPLSVATAVLIWVRHRANLERLRRGLEPPLWGRRS